jgi:hypothetical protein
MFQLMTYPGYQSIRTAEDGQQFVGHIYSADARTRTVRSNHREGMLHLMTLRMDLRMSV